jgi:hypothetical protein
MGENEMKLIALCLVRNEDWILGFSARVALQWCDSIIFYLHNCTDGTLEIVEQLESEFPERVTHLWNNSDGWQEMDMRQSLLEHGRLLGGTHFAMIDADEALTADMQSSINAQISYLNPTETLELPMRPPWKSLSRYRLDNSVWCQSWISLVFADHPSCTWKPDKIGYSHHHRLPYGVEARKHPISHNDLGGNMHLQWANWDRVKAKHCWYKMHEAITYPDKPIKDIDRMYSEAVIDENPKTSECPEAWFYGYDKWMDKIDLKPHRSWHIEECEQMLSQYGRERFAGLNLFGVV